MPQSLVSEERPFAVMHDLEQMYVAYDVLKGEAWKAAAERTIGRTCDCSRPPCSLCAHLRWIAARSAGRRRSGTEWVVIFSTSNVLAF